MEMFTIKKLSHRRGGFYFSIPGKRKSAKQPSYVCFAREERNISIVSVFVFKEL